MELLRKLAAWAAKKKKGMQTEGPAERTAEAPKGADPLVRALPEGGLTVEEQPARLRAEDVRFEFTRGEELFARGTRAVADTAKDDPIERLVLLCRRSACDIAAQDDLR